MTPCLRLTAAPRTGSWNDHRLSLAEAETFARDGFLVLPERLPAEVTDRLEEAFDKVWAAERAARGKGELEKFNMLDSFSKGRASLEMIRLAGQLSQGGGHPGLEHPDLPHPHDVLPRRAPGADPGQRGWHQDSGRLNRELETDPQPRVSLKVAFFLSDCSVAGHGNFGAVRAVT